MVDKISMQKVYQSDSLSLKLIRADIKDFLSINHVDDIDSGYIIIAINEACMNIIQHANDGEYDGDIVVNVSLLADVLTLEITDQAHTVDTNKLIGRDITAIEPGGLGIHLIKDIMDTIEYSAIDKNQGNRLLMTKKIGFHNEI